MRVLRIVGAILALGLLAAVIYHLGPAAIAHQLLMVGPGFLWLLVIHALGIAIAGLPWHVLLPRSARPTIWQSIASRFVAAGANAVTPVVSFAGDLVRLFWLPHKSDRPAGVAAIVVDRLTYGAANVLFVLGGAIALVHTGLPPEYTRITVIGFIVLAVAVGLIALLASRFRLVGRVHHLITRLRRKERDHQFGDDVDTSVQRMLRREPGQLALAFFFNVLFRLAMSAQIVVAFHLLGVTLSWEQALVFAALPIVMAVAGFMVPSQIGVQEGAQALLAHSFGIPETTAVAVVLLLRIRSLIGGAFVAVLIATKKSTLEANSTRAAASSGGAATS
ncbi:MAG TPA: lysylphosphatidylglycerol synthase domain-containing protein [Kofleriaceae bacterium]|nr:lysylphosphatidylglycerol synthase domain-containing protein [Kofleriaceae bacterium]